MSDSQQQRVFIIAEAGVNHNGDPELARQLIDAAADAGADAVKFQLFDPEEIVDDAAPLAEYQERSGEESQKEMLQSLTLTHDDYRELAMYAAERSLDFIVTPFDIASAEFLVSLDVPALKIPSGEITNHPFLQGVAALGKPVILSTGTSTMEEVREAVNIFQSAGVDLIVLHCTSAYPTPYDQVNLNAMATLRKEFGVPVGFSDHTPGIEIPIAAAAMGAEVIEKHFTLDRTMPGPDHAASLEPDELTEMVRCVRNVEMALGDGEKKRQPCEENVADVARRSVVLSCDAEPGTVITRDMLAVKRPGTGIEPKFLEQIVGRKVKEAQEAGCVLSWEMLA